MKQIVIAAFAIALLTTAAQAAPPVTDWSAVVSVDSVIAHPGDQVAVPIRISNSDTPFASIYVPLHFLSPFLQLDSVSFVGSVMTPDFTGLVAPAGYFNDTVEVTLSPPIASPVPTIAATEGLIATLWITVSPSAPAVTIAVDSLAIDSLITDGGPSARVWKFVNASDDLGMTMMPQFVPGAVIIDSPTGIDDERPGSIPNQYMLGQNYPNPFNPTTTIEFTVPSRGEVRLAVYNVIGQEVTVLVDGALPAGTHQVAWDAANRPSGIYFYRLTYPGGAVTKKMTLIK